jgi:hypothetical protein
MKRNPSPVQKPSKRMQRRLVRAKLAAELDAFYASGAVIELTDEDRAWDSMPAVGRERFWEPSKARLSFKQCLALKALLRCRPKSSTRRAR